MTDQQESGELDTAQAETEEAVEQEAQQEESAPSETAEETEESETEASDTEETPKKSGVEKRIAQLTYQLREQERRANALEQKLSANPKPTEPPREKPTLESVGYDEVKYQQAMDDYYDSQFDVKLETKLTAKQQSEAAQKASEELQKTTNRFMQKGIDLAEDFVDVVTDSSLPITEAMRDALYSVDRGPEVLYNLAQNPAEISRIAQLPPYAQAVEIGRLEALMTVPKPKTTSSAPSPIKPLNAGGESTRKNPDEMSADEWLKWRNKQLKR